ncbi:MAG: methionyl-tRNA formyltransferase [Trueperaceae bacterium]
MRVAFFGSPDFALPSLLALNERFDVALVVSQPDKAAGRGLKTRPPAVARVAAGLGLPLAQPARLRNNSEFAERLAGLQPDVAVTVAYGKLLPQALLDLPRCGFLNVHASLLPKYRGAGPVQWALINGERVTGVTIMRTEAGLDTGPACLVRATEIADDERAPELFGRLAQLGARTIVEALEKLSGGRLECRPQDDAEATFAPQLRREDGDLDWNQPAAASYDRFRGVAGWPGTRFEFAAGEVRVFDMRPVDGAGQPGEVIGLSEAGVVVATGEGALELLELQPAGKRRMSARAWANGYRVRMGATLA